MNLKNQTLFMLLCYFYSVSLQAGPYCHISDDFDEITTSTEVLAIESWDDMSEAEAFDISLLDDDADPVALPQTVTLIDKISYRIKEIGCLCAIRWYYTQAWCKEKLEGLLATLRRAERKA